jgi:hypothetical protein
MPNVADTLPKIVNNTQEYTAIIPAAGQSTSVIYCAGNSFLAVQIPSNYTTADLLFYASFDGVSGNFYQMVERLADGTYGIYTIPAAQIASAIAAATDPTGQTVAGIQIPLNPAVFSGVQNLIIKTSVAQVSAQNIKLVMAPVLAS